MRQHESRWSGADDSHLRSHVHQRTWHHGLGIGEAWVVEFVTNEEVVREARRRLNQGGWDYLVGGSESETTLRRNRHAFDRIAPSSEFCTP
jgi:hypothetical protein